MNSLFMEDLGGTLVFMGSRYDYISLGSNWGSDVCVDDSKALNMFNVLH